MGRTRLGSILMWLTVAASSVAGAASFFMLYHLRNDPLPGLGTTFRIAALLQPIPFAAAGILAALCRRRPTILVFVLVAVIGCGSYGCWWLSGLSEARRMENEPVRRQALGNILPDIEGQAGAGKALVWPALVMAAVGGSALLGWAVHPRRAVIPGSEKTDEN